MMRLTGREWILMAALVVAATMGAVLRQGQAAQIYGSQTQWHWNALVNQNTTSATWTVPSGVDLTITDIVYDFGQVNLPPGTGSYYSQGSVVVFVFDGAQSNNPTTNSTGTPSFNTGSIVTDAASIHLFDGGLGGTSPGMSSAEVSTVSHHFQTGMFFPSGNTVNLSYVNGFLPPTGNNNALPTGPVFVHMSGRLN